MEEKMTRFIFFLDIVSCKIMTVYTLVILLYHPHTKKEKKQTGQYLLSNSLKIFDFPRDEETGAPSTDKILLQTSDCWHLSSSCLCSPSLLPTKLHNYTPQQGGAGVHCSHAAGLPSGACPLTLWHRVEYTYTPSCILQSTGVMDAN